MAQCGITAPGFRKRSIRATGPMTMNDDDDDDDDSGDLRGEIVRLEAEIEQLAETIESCRKLILIAKGAMALAGVLIVAALLGAINLDPALLIGAFGVVLGGIVVFGSNASTLEQAMAATRAAELRRSQMIGQIDLRVVGGRNGGG
jgi:hypothetical protein